MIKMNSLKIIPLSCQCRQFCAEVKVSHCGPRAICYCKDCQAYAEFIKQKAGVEFLDNEGGTEVLAIRPHQICIVHGAQQLTYMSLSPNGTLRWYTQCCGTPIANMKRNPASNHISIIHSCYDGTKVSAAYGDTIFRVKPASARGVVPQNNPFRLMMAALCFAVQIGLSRLFKKHRLNPFFMLLNGRSL